MLVTNLDSNVHNVIIDLPFVLWNSCFLVRGYLARAIAAAALLSSVAMVTAAAGGISLHDALDHG